MSNQPPTVKTPKIVEIQQGKLHELLNTKMQRLLDVAHYDPDLDLAAATGALLGTAGDVNARLDFYMQYPYAFVKMIRKWFPMTYKHAITVFLKADAGDLDAGFSLVLQCLALAEEGDMAQKGILVRT